MNRLPTGTNCCIQLDDIFIRRWRSIDWDDMTFNIITFKELMTDVSTTFYKPLTHMKPDSIIDILDFIYISMQKTRKICVQYILQLLKKISYPFLLEVFGLYTWVLARHKQASESKLSIVWQNQETPSRHVLISILINSKSQKCLCEIKGYDLQSKIDIGKYKIAARRINDKSKITNSCCTKW